MTKKKTKEELIEEFKRILPSLDEKHLYMLNGILRLNREELVVYIKLMIDFMSWEKNSSRKK